MSGSRRPIVLVTGAAGQIGQAVTQDLIRDHDVVGLDMVSEGARCPCYEFDLTNRDSVDFALARIREDYGGEFAAVIHLAAYFDFTGEHSPLYDKVNVEGTRNLLEALQKFEVSRFIYSGTMLVHEPAEPGERVDEEAPIEPKWAYPESKAATERVIEEAHGRIPYLLLHLAGLYDERAAVPTLSHQIARIYERKFKSHVYAGDLRAGQAFIHKEDLVAGIRRAVERRDEIPENVSILLGEPEAVSYTRLQDMIGRLVHGAESWSTFSLPKPVARAGAWLETKSEPVVPDDFDKGEKPFIRPFMIDMADDHYALDIDRARELLDWSPKHRLEDALPAMIDDLLADPAAWYDRNGITPPDWIDAARDKDTNAETLRARHERRYLDAHRQFRWAPFLNVAMGSWLATSPWTLGYAGGPLGWNDLATGLLVMALGALSISPRFGWSRWITAALGVWLLLAPLVFWTPSAAAYANDTLVGALVVGFAVLARPAPGIGPVAATTGPLTPPGWEFSPSDWTQRLPIIVLAFVGLYFSRYLAAYQLGHIEAAWDPFFAGTLPDKNGTEQIITSVVSEAWPVSDAGLGAMTYMLEILVGIVGSQRRWRTMPWLVTIFGIMIVPLGVVSITFIVIQPIVIGTWCTLCLIGAAAMLIQIPYSLDELVATGQFLVRRARAGRPVLLIFLKGDTDEGRFEHPKEEFDRGPWTVFTHCLGGGVNLPWNLALCIAIGIWLMFTRATLGESGGMADASHLIGALVVTFTVTALAEVARPVRFLNIAFGVALAICPLAFGAGFASVVNGGVCGAALIALSLPRGPVRHKYGGWNRLIV